MRSLRATETHIARYSERPVNNQKLEYHIRLERPVRSSSPTVKNMVFWTWVHALVHNSVLKLLLEPKVSAYPYCPHVGHLPHLPWTGAASFPQGKGKIWEYPGHY